MTSLDLKLLSCLSSILCTVAKPEHRSNILNQGGIYTNLQLQQIKPSFQIIESMIFQLFNNFDKSNFDPSEQGTYTYIHTYIHTYMHTYTC